MERLTLTPEDVLVVPEGGVHNLELLQLYYTVFRRGHGGGVTPFFVVDKTKMARPPMSKEIDTEWERRPASDAWGQLYDKIQESPARYVLADGTHRSTAATLVRVPLDAILLTHATDLRAVKRMVANGELINFPHPSTSPRHIIAKFINYSLPCDWIMTLRERADMLVQEKQVPAYMARHYSRK